MRDRSSYTEGLFTGLGITALLLCLSIFISNWVSPIQYQIPTRNINPSGTPANINELTTRVENLENDQAYNFKSFEWRLDQKILYLGWIALAISVVAGFLGIKTFNDLEKIIKERVNQALEQALYQLDPTNLPIHIYRGALRRNTEGKELRSNARDDLERIAERLRLTGLQNGGFITYLDSTTLSGITIVPMDDESDEDDFIKFVEKYKFHLDKEKSGFILYTPPGYQIKRAQNFFDNTAIANMPVTVASAVLVVGRGLRNREN